MLKKRLIVFGIIFVSVAIVATSFLVGVILGYEDRPEVERVTALFNKVESKPPEVDFEPFWKVWNMLDRYYVSQGTSTEDVVDEQEKVWGAIRGLVDSLGDPYTTFLPPEESKMFDQEVSGNFGGVGIEVGVRDGLLTVIAPLKNSPAERAGVIAGDKIVEINGKPTSNISVHEAVMLIRGEPGTQVVLTLFRDGEILRSATLTRDIITVPTIETSSLSGGVFLIKLYNFNAISVGLFDQALREFEETGGDKLIIDLRGNAGGYLSAAIDMASRFLPSGKTVVIEDRGGKGKQKVYRSHGRNQLDPELKLAVLIDGGSASASEILAGALSEHGRATLVGERTFGKASVQELMEVTPDTSLKVTIARWLTPGGVSLSENGLTPDIEVEWKRGDEIDLQLESALDYLLKN